MVSRVNLIHYCILLHLTKNVLKILEGEITCILLFKQITKSIAYKANVYIFFRDFLSEWLWYHSSYFVELIVFIDLSCSLYIIYTFHQFTFMKFSIHMDKMGPLDTDALSQKQEVDICWTWKGRYSTTHTYNASDQISNQSNIHKPTNLWWKQKNV